MDIVFRRFTPADLPALVQLNRAAAAVDEGITHPLDSLPPENEIYDPALSQFGWLAQVDSGEIAGYVHLDKVAEANGGVNFWLRGVVHPRWRRRGLGRELVRRSWRDMRQASGDCQNEPAFVNAWAYDYDEARRRLFSRFGLQPYHIYYELAIPAADVGPALPLPLGIEIRPWRDDHCEAAVALRNEAFAYSWGYQPTTASALRRCFKTGRYETTYSFTAWRWDGPNDTRMIGLVHGCLNWTRKVRRTNEGEIVWIAVTPQARGLGIGRVLLLTAMNAFRANGVEVISVGADSPADQPAIGLYTKLGFKVRKAIVDYRGDLCNNGSAEKS